MAWRRGGGGGQGEGRGIGQEVGAGQGMGTGLGNERADGVGAIILISDRLYHPYTHAINFHKDIPYDCLVMACRDQPSKFIKMT